MVWHSSNTNEFGFEILCLFHNDGVEFALMFGINCLFTTISAEHDMVNGLYIAHNNMMY